MKQDAAWPLTDRLLYYTTRALERLTRGRCRIVRYYFFAQRVRDKPAVTPSAQTRLYFASADDRYVRQALRPEHVISHRFASGARCVTATAQDELAGFIWLKHHGYEEDEVRCRYRWQPDSAAAWDFDVWVAPAHRATRVFARLWDYAHQYLRSCGCRWTLSRISAFNPGSLAAHRRIGLVPMGSGTFFVLGRLQVSFTTRPWRVHWSTSERSAPELIFTTPDAERAGERPTWSAAHSPK